MAERKLESSDVSLYFLWIDPANGTSYDNVVCLNTFNFNLTNTTNTTTTMCGPMSTPGDQTMTIDFDGIIMLEADSGRISAPDIYPVAQGKTTFAWKIGKATPVTGDVVKTGHGFFSDYREAFSATAPGGFSGTISVDGAPTHTVTA